MELAPGMPREITGLDLRRGRTGTGGRSSEDELLRAIDAMIAHQPAGARAARLERGAELRARFAASIRIEPVGLLPLYTREGYLLHPPGRETRVRTRMR